MLPMMIVRHSEVAGFSLRTKLATLVQLMIAKKRASHRWRNAAAAVGHTFEMAEFPACSTVLVSRGGPAAFGKRKTHGERKRLRCETTTIASCSTRIDPRGLVKLFAQTEVLQRMRLAVCRCWRDCQIAACLATPPQEMKRSFFKHNEAFIRGRFRRPRPCRECMLKRTKLPCSALRRWVHGNYPALAKAKLTSGPGENKISDGR